MDPIRLKWPGGDHPFALRLGELRRMQETCNAGPEEVLARLNLGTWRVDDIIEPLRLGLIGGGMPDGEAGPLVVKLIEQHALHVFRLFARAVLTHALYGPEDDQPEKPEGVETPAPENGDSPTSTQPEP